MRYRSNLTLALFTGMVCFSAAKAADCPNVATFKTIINAKQPAGPFEAMSDGKGGKWVILRRLKTETKDKLDELTVEPQARTTALPNSTKATTCTYYVKNEADNLLDQAKIIAAVE